MGTLWRSQPMHLVQFFIPLDAAHDTVDQLGDIGQIQFRDLNAEVNLFQRNFVNEVKRSDDMMRKLRYFSDQIRNTFKAPTDETPPTIPEIINQLQLTPEEVGSDNNKEQSFNMDDLETYFDELEKELTTMGANQDKLSRNFNELVEFRHVLLKDAQFFSSETSSNVVLVGEGNDDMEAPLLSDENRGAGVYGQSKRLGYLTGVINSDKVPVFERLLWRASRGNMFFRPSPIEGAVFDPNSGKLVTKDVFIIFFQGSRLQAKIKKICESFGAHIYPCPETGSERAELLSKLSTRLQELEDVIQRSGDLRLKVLKNILFKWEGWKDKVSREKSIYHTMNMFNYDIGRRCLIAEGWCPVSATDRVQEALKTANKVSGSSVPTILHIVPTNDEPPTYYKTDRFTEAFQNIVDSYGIARYQEVNPAVFAIITFPFLFGVMFGDIGHGFLLTIFALVLIWKEKQLGAQKLNEMLGMMFSGRYMLLLMGIFSTYVGLVYNDAFGVPTNFFWWMGERWGHPIPGDDQYVWLDKPTPYIFGVDPTWKYRKNELNYYNSLKMKMSIILGVTQMTLGVIISAFNALHFKKYLNFFFEFIPQMIFLLGIFGYLCFLIILKWCTDWRDAKGDVGAPPSLLTTMINLFLKITSPIETEPLNMVLYSGQHAVQVVIVLVAVAAVPVMLLVKPLVLRSQHKKKVAEEARRKAADHSQGIHHSHEDNNNHSEGSGRLDEEDGEKKEVKKAASSGGGHGGHGDEEFEFSEVFVHQIIHTIEFVLGSVSNTASYLRLWALSLAHSELAYVFWSQIMIRIMSMKLGAATAPAMFLAFGPWAALTVGVLLIMESLSAFLHALRLHWVEFMNKFYAGDGHSFEPFSYVAIARAEEESEEATGKR